MSSSTGTGLSSTTCWKVAAVTWNTTSSFFAGFGAGVWAEEEDDDEDLPAAPTAGAEAFETADIRYNHQYLSIYYLENAYTYYIHDL